MKHTFRNEKPKTFEVLPEGDYLLEVTKADNAISQGAKTRGCDVLEITLKSVEHSTSFEEMLISHESTSWKIDLFVNCFALASEIGQEVDLSPENLIGRRGWCKVGIREYEKADKTKGKANQILVYYTDREKFPRTPAPAPAPAPMAEDSVPWA